MQTLNKHTIPVGIIILVLTSLITGCPGSGGQTPLEVALQARVEDSTVILTWDVSDLASFKVFRRSGGGDFAEIAAESNPAASFTDTTCPENTELSYRLTFTLVDSTSFDSLVSNTVIILSDPVSYQTVSITASRLEYNDRIRIFWDAVPGAEAYRLYRAESEDFSTAVTFPCPANQYDDVSSGAGGPSAGTPYFYKVACVIDDVVYPGSTVTAAGLFRAEIDYFEENDSRLSAEETGGVSETACLFSFDDGILQDVDWYKYTGDETSVRITISLEPESLLAGEARLVVENTGASLVLAEGDNSLDYTGGEDLFFRVEFIYFNPPGDILDDYEVGLTFF